MALRAIRGATCLSADDADEMSDAVAELVREIVARNQLNSDDLVSILLTCTPDLVCAFPAAAVRRAGITDVPLMCAQEMNVTGALARVVRVMMHVDLDTPRSDVQHVYLRGAEVLRVDLAVADAQAGESST